jgi:CheY-like chemotaxis protein
MSHDMRTPLNAIVGLSKLALTEEKGMDEFRNARNMQNIHNASRILLSLVNNLLDISKIESGRFELSPAIYETPIRISDTTSINIVRLAGKPVVFRLNLDETLPVRLRGDDLRVQQIFNNLLSNAFKYTERGEVEWALSWEREGDSVWLVSSVRDTGVGIRPESLEKIFSDYNRIDADAMRKTESTGLGLPIAWNLAKLMDGELTVKSEFGKGSTFFVRVRQGFVDDEPIGAELARQLEQFQYSPLEKAGDSRLVYRDLSHASALVVDDVESNLEVAAGMLRRYGMQVDCATGAQQAIDMARAKCVRYDVIFMDHMMPGMDGIEALQRIRAIGTQYAKSVPIVALTANALSGSEQRFLENGFQAFLAKPIDMWQLDAMLRRFIPDEAQEGAKRDDAGGGRTDETPSSSLPQNTAIDGLDTQGALKRFAGDAKAYRQALESYLRHTPALLEKARAVSRERLADYTIVMHGIKGGGLNVGATQVSQKAAALEAAARSDDFAFIAAHNADCLDTAARLLSDLSVLLAKTADKTEKPLKNAPDAETLARLETACAAYDMDGVDRAMAELESYRYRERQELVVWLSEQARAMELQRMAEKLARYGKED